MWDTTQIYYDLHKLHGALNSQTGPTLTGHVTSEAREVEVRGAAEASAPLTLNEEG